MPIDGGLFGSGSGHDDNRSELSVMKASEQRTLSGGLELAGIDPNGSVLERERASLGR